LRIIFFGFILHNFGDKGFYPHNSEDSEQYLTLAKNLSEHSVFSRNETSPFENEFFRTPGYPFVISIFYRFIPVAWPTVLFQDLLALFVIVIIYKLCILLLRKKSIALLAAAIYACEPAVIYWNNQLLSETLFTFILVVSVYIFVKKILINRQVNPLAFLVTGALLACLNYVRPVAQFILLVFVIFSLAVIKKINFCSFFRYFVAILLMVAAFIILISPWAARNKVLFNTFDLSSASKTVAFRKYLTMTYLNVGDNVAEIGDIKMNDLKLVTLKYIAAHPIAFMEVHLSNMIPFFLGDSYFTTAAAIYPPLEQQRVVFETWFYSWKDILKIPVLQYRGVGGVIFLGGKAILLILNLFALFGVLYWIFGFKDNRISAVFLLFLIYYFVLATGVASYSRFRQPVNPYIYIYIALGVYGFAYKIKNATKK